MSDKYLKFARYYPTISAMAIPVVVATAMCVETGQIPDTAWSAVTKLLTFAPIAGVFVALGFWFTEISRFLSLFIMEKTRFKSCGKNMPTTELLLGKNGKLSKSMHQKLSERLLNDCEITLPGEDVDEEEARAICVNVTGLMREKTRDNKILAQYNHEFGFCRNYIGASLVAIIILAIQMCIAFHFHLFIWWPIGGLLLQLVLCWFFWKALCISGEQYANHLIYAYISKL
ncbi:MAG: hypothetical protein NC453_30140 [Muribaculum sp.]|nr:hypothetical protein [Muribaculum sp.]